MVNYILLVIVVINIIINILSKNVNGYLGWAVSAILVIGNIGEAP